MRDFTSEEIEAIAALEKGSLFDDWCSWAGRHTTPGEAWATWGEVDPEMARSLSEIHDRAIRLNRGCQRLFRRGLVERQRKRGLLGNGGYWYRLLPPLRPVSPTVTAADA